jgi:predicted polyphosphate/ATP-dependent NAD kinase
MKRIIGLIVNPVAGMGGSVGLKGTDGDMYKRALALGAEPVTPKRTDQVLSHIKKKDRITLVVAPGKMGERYTSACVLPFKVIGTAGDGTSKEDTKRISKEMVGKGAELLVFVGGDGTARDVYDAIGPTIPVVAVPAGVKVFSSVFAVSARAAAEMVDAFVDMGIQILDLSDQLSPGFIRVSISTRDENDAFMQGYVKICET